VLMTVGELDEASKGWIAIATPCLDLGSIELVIVVARGSVDAKMLRIKGLDNHPARLFTTSGTPCNLGEQGKRSFRRCKIRQIEGNICRDDPYQRYPWQVKPLGNHLGPYQDIGLTLGKAIKQSLMCPVIACRIAIPAQQAGRRKSALDGIHDLFCP